MPEPETNFQTLITRIEQLRTANRKPLYIGIDGRSGSGKSTLASQIQTHFGKNSVGIIEGDSFYTGGSGALWDHRSATDNAHQTIDCCKLDNTIRALKNTGAASWQAFDWHSELWDTDTPPFVSWSALEKSIMVIEGVYTARHELGHCYDFRVLLDTPLSICTARVKTREGSDYCPIWAGRWARAEQIYFQQMNTYARFDLIMTPPVT